jgi:hypothetical protein
MNDHNIFALTELILHFESNYFFLNRFNFSDIGLISQKNADGVWSTQGGLFIVFYVFLIYIYIYLFTTYQLVWPKYKTKEVEK